MIGGGHGVHYIYLPRKTVSGYDVWSSVELISVLV